MNGKDELKEKDVGTRNKREEKPKEKLSEEDIKELMGHAAYKRHKGAIKQVR